MHGESIIDGIFELLATLQQSTKLSVVTSRPQADLLRELEVYELKHAFCCISDADNAKQAGLKEKPHPDKLLWVSQQTGIATANIIMIGDTTMDIGMAKSAGAIPIGVTWGMGEHEDLLSHGAHAVVNSVDELHKALVVLFL